LYYINILIYYIYQKKIYLLYEKYTHEKPDVIAFGVLVVVATIDVTVGVSVRVTFGDTDAVSVSTFGITVAVGVIVGVFAARVTVDVFFYVFCILIYTKKNI